MMCFKNKLVSELDTIKRILIENGYPEKCYFSLYQGESCQFFYNKQFGPEKFWNLSI